ncbi:MAG: PAS domain S-box protein [Thermoleophilaceae bacterium]|nr:PAS domain S-box protein [Thermoleophilaceae bacterium]
MASLKSIPGGLPGVGGPGPSPDGRQAERLAELSPVLLLVADSGMRITSTSPALQRALGWSGEELAGRNWLELFDAADLATADQALHRARTTPGTELNFETRTVRRGAERCLLHWTAAYADGCFHAAARDITAQRRAEGRLATGDQRFGALIEQVPAIVYTAAFGEAGRWSFVSGQVERMLGWTPEEWTADERAWIKSIHPDDRDRVLDDEDLLEGPGDQLKSEYRVVARDGSVLWVRDAATVIQGEGGELLMQGLLLDVTDLKRAEDAALASEEKYRSLVETSQDLIWAIDVENRFTFVNDAVRTIFGYEPEEMVGRPFTDFQEPEHAQRDLEAASGLPEGELLPVYESHVLHKSGRTVVLSTNSAVLRDGEGNVIGATGTARDVTEQRRIEGAVAAKHLQLQSIIDNSPLVIYAKDSEHRYAIANRELEVMLGLPAGGAVGRADDELLIGEQAAGRRMADQRVLDTGHATESEELLSVAGRERAYLLHRFALREPDGTVYGVCGIGTDITERREREDTLRAKLEWSVRIRRAIDEDRLVLHGQPIVDVRTGEAVQEELLVRMIGEDGGLVMPGVFLPPAERFHLVPIIDRWVICQAASLAAERRVEVNLSGQSIGDASLVEYVETQLREAGADPSNVVFEITETAAARDIGQATRLAKRLSELGCGFALDDFGTGYGSFTYLKHLPVDYIKIDMEFVRNLRVGSPDVQVVSAIIDVARKFGIQTVAEGVECQETLELLGELGADFAQGYHLGFPAPVGER